MAEEELNQSTPNMAPCEEGAAAAFKGVPVMRQVRLNQSSALVQSLGSCNRGVEPLTSRAKRKAADTTSMNFALAATRPEQVVVLTRDNGITSCKDGCLPCKMHQCQRRRSNCLQTEE